MRRFLGIPTFAVALAIGFTAIATAAPSATGAPVTVGAVLALTGPFAPLGEPVRNAILLAEDDVNAHGGIGGRKLDIAIRDDEGKPDTAAELATGFVGTTPIVIGSSVTPPSSGIARVAANSAIVQIYLTPTAQLWDTPRGVVAHVFEVAPRSGYEAERIVAFVREKLHGKHVALVYDENTYGTAGEAAVKAALAKNGVDLVVDESYGTSATDATAQLVKVKGSDADVLVVWGASPTTGIIVRQARSLGIKVPIVGSAGILTDHFIDVAGGSAEGVYSTSYLNFSHPNPQERAFVAAYQARFHERPEMYAVNGWNAVHVVAEALRAVPGGDADKIATWFEHMPSYMGTMPIRFHANDHEGAATVYYATVRGGTWETL
jgi:branched-chain amino acid transport system substrate-binding protein